MKSLLCVGLAACLCASVAGSGERITPSCDSLRDVRIPAKQIGLATRGARVTQVRSLEAAAGPYCLVDGEVQSVGARAQNIKFQMVFPNHWNGSMVHLGGGGLDGQVVSPTQPNGIVAPVNLIARGYIVYGSDSGHQGSDASFALNDEELRNYGGDQLKKTLDVAVGLAKAFYGSAPRHRYFVGGSAGGREAFTAAQKFGQDYDGIVSFFPGNELIPLTLKFWLVHHAMDEKGGIGHLGPAEADLVERAELAACDQDDGIKDGIIGNPKACNFQFASLRCPNAAAPGGTCLSDAQVATLQLMHTRQEVDVSFADGTHSLAAFDVGAALGSFYTNTDAVTDFVRCFFLRDAHADVSSFDSLRPGRVRARIEALSAQYDRTSRDVDAFVAKGGKWIIVHGLADELVPSQNSIDYYESIVAKYGQTKADDFLRLYLVPGYAHGHGAPFDASYGPYFDALEHWVESGNSPETLTAIDQNPAGHGRSRPSCAYPALLRYKGSGNPDDAGSFTCTR